MSSVTCTQPNREPIPVAVGVAEETVLLHAYDRITGFEGAGYVGNPEVVSAFPFESSTGIVLDGGC
jgi:hypothetical protein